MLQPLRIRDAGTEDAAAIATIFNQGVADRVATFETVGARLPSSAPR